MTNVKRKRNQLPRVFRDVTNVTLRTSVDVMTSWMGFPITEFCLIVMCMGCSALSKSEVSHDHIPQKMTQRKIW